MTQGPIALPPSPLPWVPGVQVRSFLLPRAEPVVIYNSPALAQVRFETRPERLLLSHWHEALGADPGIPAYIHEADRTQTRMTLAGTFTGRTQIAPDLLALPMPGHTAGNMMFLWETAGQIYLFPGDSFWVQGGVWKAVLLGESDRAAYISSLESLSQLHLDMILPWGHETGAAASHAVPGGDMAALLSPILGRLKAGAMG